NSVKTGSEIYNRDKSKILRNKNKYNPFSNYLCMSNASGSVADKPGKCPKCGMTLEKKTLALKSKTALKPEAKSITEIKAKSSETKINTTHSQITYA
ncbi:hypothetical protein BOQ60_24565, partial [Chryseobacterium sp. CH1]